MSEMLLAQVCFYSKDVIDYDYNRIQITKRAYEHAKKLGYKVRKIKDSYYLVRDWNGMTFEVFMSSYKGYYSLALSLYPKATLSRFFCSLDINSYKVWHGYNKPDYTKREVSNGF